MYDLLLFRFAIFLRYLDAEMNDCKQQTIIEVRQVIKLCLNYVLLFLTDFQTRVSRRSLPRYQSASMWPKCGHAIGLSLDELFEMSLRSNVPKLINNS